MSLPKLRPHHLDGKENEPVLAVVEGLEAHLENGLILLQYSSMAKIWYYKAGTSLHPLVPHVDDDVDGPYYRGFYAIPDEPTT